MDIGLDHFGTYLFKNPVFAFSDGHLVAEIIHSRYPSIVSKHSYDSKGDVEGKVGQWRQLLRRPLKLLDMVLTDEEVLKIVGHQVSREEVFSYLRLLISKLSTYGKRASSTGLTPARQEKQREQPKTSPSPSPTANQPSVSKLPASSATSKYLTLYAKKKEVGKIASTMSEAEIEKLYLSFSDKLRVAAEVQVKKNDDIQKKSDLLHAHFLELKEINSEEMEKVNKRLGLLEREVKAAELGNAFLTTLVRESVDDEFSENPASRRAREITKTILSLASTKPSTSSPVKGKDNNTSVSANPESVLSNAGEDTSGVPPSKESSKSEPSKDDITSVFDFAKVSSEVWEIKMGNDDTGKKEDDDANSLCPVSPPTHLPRMHLSADHLEKSAQNNSLPRAATMTEESLDEPKSNENQPAVNTTATVDISQIFTRVFDNSTRRNFYVNKGTGQSQWTAPTKGIVVCTDGQQNTFFVDVSTGKSSWSLESLYT